MKVLIVEDEALVAADLQDIMEGLGYEIVGVARSLQEAEHVLETRAVDFVLLDIVLQGASDGIDLAHAIRRRYGLPFIFVTAHTDPATVRRARATQAYGYLVKPFTRESVFAAVEVALGHRADEAEPESPPARNTGGLAPHRLREVKAFIHEKFAQDLNLDALAEVAGMSKYHFCRTFRHSTGVTPYQYLLEVRIDRAKRLLQSSDEALGQISREVGFNSQSQFNRAFRKLTGTTPGIFRRSA